MADTKISALPSGAPAQAGDEYVIARGGANYKLTGTNLLGLVTGTANTFTATQTFGTADVTTLEASNLRALDGTPAATVANSTGVISVSTKIEYADGTAAAPTVTNTGDTDTGMYFPAANEVAVAAGGSVAAAFNSNGVFFRNRIINGDMRIDQRNAGASVSTTTGGNYITDRFFVQCQTNGNLTGQQSTTVPDSTFKNSLVATVSSAAAPIATGVNDITHRVEGFNVADFGFGAAGAQTVTVSFWARSSVTGTYSISFASVGSGSGRWYVTTYSLTANTWTKITIVVPGDTSGTWNTTTSTGFQIYWSLGTGSTYQTSTLNSWQTGTNLFAATTETAWCNNAGATFYITGVQLETGSVATPFERRPYGTELMLCQRYYIKYLNSGTNTLYAYTGVNISSTRSFHYVALPVPMRSAPSVAEVGAVVGDAVGSNLDVTAISVYASSANSINLDCTHASGYSTSVPLFLGLTASTGYFELSSEL
jgi:hypothetical protein